MSSELTEKQKGILDFIAESIREKNLPPTLREIGKRFGFSSTGTPRQYLKALVEKGYIRYKNNMARGIELLQDTPGIPLLGRVSAGRWNQAVENPEDFIDLTFLKKRPGLFALQVKGDSMEGAGIFEGDFAIIQKQETAHPGEIVVAGLEDDAVIKRFFRTEDGIVLESSNPKYPAIVTKSAVILGKVVSIVRKY